MEKLYEIEPYQAEFEAIVLSCGESKGGYLITLDRTAFYPEGGGQPYDIGILGDAAVLEVHEREGQVFHLTDKPLEAGGRVKGRIDWERRFSNMQQHSGEHIVSGLIHTAYGYDNVGFHMGGAGMSIDLNGELSWEQLMEIEQKANQIVYENRELRVTYPSEQELASIDYRSKKELTGRIRIVEVPGADVCACCGTHVSRTGEIGLIKFLSLIRYKGGVRILMLCGSKALEDYERKTEQINYLSGFLSAKTEKVTEAVERVKRELEEKEQQLISLTRQLFGLKAEQYEDGQERLLVFEDGLLPVQVRQFCNLLMEQGKARVTMVCSAKGDGGFHYCIASPDEDVREVARELNARLNGRGGGSARMVQGSFQAAESGVREAFQVQVNGDKSGKEKMDGV